VADLRAILCFPRVNSLPFPSSFQCSKHRSLFLCQYLAEMNENIFPASHRQLIAYNTRFALSYNIVTATHQLTCACHAHTHIDMFSFSLCVFLVRSCDTMDTENHNKFANKKSLFPKLVDPINK
jgi:hypothetical protein